MHEYSRRRGPELRTASARYYQQMKHELTSGDSDNIIDETAQRSNCVQTRARCTQRVKPSEE